MRDEKTEPTFTVPLSDEDAARVLQISQSIADDVSTRFGTMATQQFKESGNDVSTLLHTLVYIAGYAEEAATTGSCDAYEDALMSAGGVVTLLLLDYQKWHEKYPHDRKGGH